MSPRFLPRLVLCCFALVLVAQAQVSDPSLAVFKKNPAWTAAETVSVSADGHQLASSGAGGGALFCADTAPAQLQSRTYMGDTVVSFEFLQAPGGEARVYLEGRYGFEFAADRMGALLPAADRELSQDDAVPPVAAAGGAPGTWQTFEAVFRAPRFDDARNKTQHALILELKINGHTVQSNVVRTGYSAGTEMAWEDAGGPLSIGVKHGGFAVRNVAIRRANFDAVRLPAQSGQSTNVGQLIDIVKQGEATFRTIGCAECHAVQKGDLSTKAGPNLYGIFALEPREITVASGAEGHRFTVKADYSYLLRSVRTPAEDLAIVEAGPNAGQPFPPAMPTFLPEVLSETQIQAIYAYLGTLNEPAQQTAAIHLVETAPLPPYDPLTDRLQLLVNRRVLIQRGPMEHVSGRAIHVGQPNGVNFTFDPRLLGIVQVWQGGFIDLTGEWTNRGGRGLKMGYQSRVTDLGPAGVLLAPLNAQGKPIDFSFKDAIFHDAATIHESLYSKRDHLDRLAEINARFLGYTRDSSAPDAVPTFNFQVGANTLSLHTEIAADGHVNMALMGNLSTDQSFQVDEVALGHVMVSAGHIEGGRWLLPAGTKLPATLDGKLSFGPSAWRPATSNFAFDHQPLVVEPSHPQLPRGYHAESYLGPKDNYGRQMLFEALGLAVAPDGTLVVATRTAGVWRLVNGEWRLFAEGLFDSLGVQVEDQQGFTVVAGQKAELTRIRDTNGDGLADSYETMTDAFSFHGNYHSYMHGPVRAPDGSYFLTLNLDDASSVPFDNEYRANGKYMGTSGGFRGWAVHVPAAGGFEPWASGLRSPAGIGFGPDGRLWYTENQGEYVGTSKLFVLKRDAFYGHPAGLVDLPGMTPDSPEIAWDKVWARRERPVLLFPENRLANSPGHPTWDTTGGQFGPFASQLFVGDQTQSNLLRITIDVVDGIEQGAAIPFATGLESGVMRSVFLPDHSMLLGETGRGWQAKGGKVASLQHIVWDGKTLPPAIHHVSAVAGGFAFTFTQPVPASFDNAALAKLLKVRSWVYRDAPDYGSPEMDDHDEDVTAVELSQDRLTLRIVLAKTEQPVLHPQQTARVYRLTLNAKPLWGDDIGPGFEAFYTLYKFPAAK